jgi:ABC-type multidrug transport system ATPase subunit/ABC-type multidrug transport system permease subunit
MSDRQKETSHLLAEEQPLTLATADEIQKVVLKWENLSFSIDSSDKPLNILKSVSGFANPQEILAIMGLSGCGKTTLLSLLSNQLVMESKFIIKGDMWLNTVNTDNINTSSIIRFIPQESILFEFLSPFEFLKFNLNLRVSGTKQEIKERINKVLTQFKLTKVQHSIIGGNIVKGLSGGEKKRVVIASEMMLLPSVLILDEPTSGLDSYLAKSVFESLKIAADLGVAVITTVHQPSFDMFKMIDRLCLMQEGRFVYQGRASKSVDYFNDIGYQIGDHVNPPEHFIKIIRIEDRNNLTEEELKTIKILSEKYDSLGESIWDDINKDVAGNSAKELNFETKFFKSFLWMVWRETINIRRNPFCCTVKVFQTFLFAILFDMLFHNLDYDSEGVEDRGGLILLIFFIFTFIPNFNASMNVANERSIVLKEIKECLYSPYLYLFTKSIFEIPLMIFTILVMIFSTYFVADLNQDGAYKIVNMILISMLTYTVGFVSGLLGGVLAVTPILSQPISSTISMGMLLLGGFITDAESPPDFINWLRFLTPYYFLRNAMLKNEFDDLDLDDDVVYEPEDRYNYDGSIIENSLISIVHIVVLATITLLIFRLQIKNIKIVKS